MNETWYILEDGTFANPAEVSAGKGGKLAHATRGPVAYGAHGNPRTRGMSEQDIRDAEVHAPASQHPPQPTPEAFKAALGEANPGAAPVEEAPVEEEPVADRTPRPTPEEFNAALEAAGEPAAEEAPAKGKAAKKDVTAEASGKGYTTRESKAR